MKQLTTANAVGEAIVNSKSVFRRMDKHQSELLIHLATNPNFTLPEDVELPFIIKVGMACLKAHGVPYTDGALMLLACMSDRPGTMILYCAVLKHLANKLGRAATVDDLCADDVFGFGFPGEDTLSLVWEAQKRHGFAPNNWLDTAEAWT